MSTPIEYGTYEQGKVRTFKGIEKAIDYLDDNIGTTIDDPGYFGE